MQFKNVPLSEEFDRDLLRRVRGFLYQKAYPRLRALDITVDRGIVVIRGQVPTYYLRQVAVECIRHVAGVTQVVDLIEVTAPEQRPKAREAPRQETSAETNLHRKSGVPSFKRMAQPLRGTQVNPANIRVFKEEQES